MVFRSLGEVDRALAAVDPNDVPAVLKTIEEFAVECSINKVWSSEALAYVTQWPVQVRKIGRTLTKMICRSSRHSINRDDYS
jgi:hypothetical protein